MFPPLFKRIFGNNGAGPQLRQDILPDNVVKAAQFTAHTDQYNAHGATVTATANRLMLRDSAGRVQVAAGAAAADAVNKGQLDKHFKGIGPLLRSITWVNNADTGVTLVEYTALEDCFIVASGEQNAPGAYSAYWLYVDDSLVGGWSSSVQANGVMYGQVSAYAKQGQVVKMVGDRIRNTNAERSFFNVHSLI